MSDNDLTIVAVGDLAFNGAYHRILRQRGADYPFRSVLPAWRKADLRLGNLESLPTSHDRFAPVKFTLRASPLTLESVQSAGFACLCVANNHMMDLGPTGLLHASSMVKSSGIPLVGAGRNEEEAYAPAILEVRGQRVGILAFCDVVQVTPLYATENSVGVARWESSVCLARVRELRQHVDWLIVHMHWGIELAQLPSPQQREWAKAIISAGADLIVGHHPHVLQPIEVIDGAIVAYSLGNCLFSGAFWRGQNEAGEEFSSKFRLHPLTRQTGWLEVTFRKGASTKHRFHSASLERNHCIVSDNSPRRAVKWRELTRQLTASDYAEHFQREIQRTEERAAWGRYDKTLGRRAELKLFQWGLLPWAAHEA